MAEIFKAPESISPPNYNFGKYTRENADREEKRYLDDIRVYLKANGLNGRNAGEVIQIPMADSSAQYMVASMKPLRLIHLRIMDEWDSEFAELLTAKKVDEMIASNKAMAKLFN